MHSLRVRFASLPRIRMPCFSPFLQTENKTGKKVTFFRLKPLLISYITKYGTRTESHIMISMPMTLGCIISRCLTLAAASFIILFLSVYAVFPTIPAKPCHSDSICSLACTASQCTALHRVHSHIYTRISLFLIRLSWFALSPPLQWKPVQLSHDHVLCAELAQNATPIAHRTWLSCQSTEFNENKAIQSQI